MADAQIRAVISAKDEASGVLSKFGSGIGSAVKAIGAGVAVAGAAVTAFGVASVKAFSESENLIAQTNAVLKSTGGIAGVTADQVDKLSKSLQATTKFSDEEVRSAENLLLTFTAIGKDIFPQATKTVLNMATALGEDTKSASIQLGKALQDPILGVTALRRVGVNFSEAQQDVIKNLVNTGKSAEAQKLILKELETEFGGSAEAAGTTFAGSLVKLKNIFNDMMEVVGKGIVDAITPFVQAIANFVTTDKFKDWIEKTTVFMSNFFTQIAGVVQALWPSLVKAFQVLLQIGVAVWNGINIAIQALMPSLKALWDTFVTQLWPALVNLWNNGGKVLAEGLAVGLFVAIWAVINALNVIFKVASYVINSFVDFIHKVGTLVGWFNTLAHTGQGVADGLRRAFVSAFNFIADAYNATFGKLKVSIPSWVPGLGGKEWHVQQMPHFASGVQNFSGGMAVVGEQGPEIVNLPRGSSVIPNNQINNVSQPTINISLNGVFTGTPQEARKLANMVLDNLKDVANAKNMTLAELMR